MEFYASWCGHCQHFAKPFRAFASSVKPWSRWARVAAIDCANTTNTDTCGAHNITGFPTLKLFRSAATVHDADPEGFKSRTLRAMRQEVRCGDLLTEAHAMQRWVWRDIERELLIG